MTASKQEGLWAERAFICNNCNRDLLVLCTVVKRILKRMENFCAQTEAANMNHNRLPLLDILHWIILQSQVHREGELWGKKLTGNMSLLSLKNKIRKVLYKKNMLKKKRGNSEGGVLEETKRASIIHKLRNGESKAFSVTIFVKAVEERVGAKT